MEDNIDFRIQETAQKNKLNPTMSAKNKYDTSEKSSSEVIDEEQKWETLEEESYETDKKAEDEKEGGGGSEQALPRELLVLNVDTRLVQNVTQEDKAEGPKDEKDQAEEPKKEEELGYDKAEESTKEDEYAYDDDSCTSTPNHQHQTTNESRQSEEQGNKASHLANTTVMTKKRSSDDSLESSYWNPSTADPHNSCIFGDSTMSSLCTTGDKESPSFVSVDITSKNKRNCGSKSGNYNLHSTSSLTASQTSATTSSWSYLWNETDSISTNDSLVPGLDGVDIGRCTVRSCHFNGLLNQPDIMWCQGCGVALVANPCPDIDHQIALNLQQKAVGFFSTD